MKESENPYHPPVAAKRVLGFNWKWLGLLNLAIICSIGALIFCSMLWAKYTEAQIEQQIGRRYASYDAEFVAVIDPIVGLILLFLVFAIPNAIFIAAQVRSHQASS